VEGGQVQGGGGAQRAGEGAALLRCGQALGAAVEVGTPAGQPVPGVGYDGAAARDHPEQLGRRRLGPAAHAGPRGAGPACHGAQPAGGEATGASAFWAAGSTSGRMSMRHPVSRAASRAFCPSLPMASDSW
jgi:hypothetical protein